MEHEVTYTILSNECIAHDVYRMELAGNTERFCAPGQFVNIQLPNLYLRRPISVAHYEPGKLVLVYKVVGKGTTYMSGMQPNQTLTMLVGLGNGYDLSLFEEEVLLVGGGVGVPPMYGLAEALRAQGKECHVVLGFNRQEDVFFEEAFQALGCDVHVCTMDGSYGRKGVVTDSIAKHEWQSLSYGACGPMGMLKAVVNQCDHGQVSLEERMGCGFGACMGCSIQTKTGTKRVCKEGPVFRSEDLLWND